MRLEVNIPTDLEARWARQIPYATSRALNWLGRRVAEIQNAAIPGRFHIRKRSLLRPGTWNECTPQRPFGIMMRGLSTKSSPVVTVGVSPAQPFWAKFELGGYKVMRSAPLTVPTKAIRPTPTAAIAMSWYPTHLGVTPLRGPAGEAVSVGRGKRSRKTARARVANIFEKRGPNGEQLDARGAGIWLRNPGRQRPTFLWKYRSSVPIPAALRFYETAARVVREEWGTMFRMGWALAVSTARAPDASAVSVPE